ncbi:MAG: hypothetical protein JEZ04_00650 [Spirochaetales bacterium]|nr:hypothetical protein [Spirochaetales bacterium]
MEIFINDEKIDFKLEDETMLYQVVDGLASWTAGNGYYIQAIHFDDKKYTAEDPACRDIPVETVLRLKISAKSRMEIHEENLQLLYQYISLFLKSIEGKNIQLIKDLQVDADSITKLLADFLGEDRDGEETISRKLYKNLIALNPENPEKKPEQLQALNTQLVSLKIILNERILELANPLGELQKTTRAMKTSVIEINDISVLLQTGKDREALNSIIKFSELSQKILRIYPLLKNNGIIDIENITIDEKNFSEYYVDLNDILSELLEAFTANDSVLIGDLLEYEVAPRIESLVAALDLIQKE